MSSIVIIFAPIGLTVLGFGGVRRGQVKKELSCIAVRGSLRRDDALFWIHFKAINEGLAFLHGVEGFLAPPEDQTDCFHILKMVRIKFKKIVNIDLFWHSVFQDCVVGCHELASEAVLQC